MASAAILDNRAVIALEGSDARNFLQGLITNDVGQCAPGRAIYAALLTPQGKILFDFFVAAVDNGLWLDCASPSVSELARRLGFYRLRAKVGIATKTEIAVAVVWNGPALPAVANGTLFLDPRLPELGLRIMAPRQQAEAAIAAIPRDDCESFRLQVGVPDSVDLPPDQVFALDAGLEELHGVSFTKGCYVGQEVTSRMKHRATARRRFYIAEADAVPPPGTSIEAEGRELGRISSAKGVRGLALVRLDRLAEAKQNSVPLLANGKPIALHRPSWLHV
jgi:tRNA-modifying protein YgfZ